MVCRSLARTPGGLKGAATIGTGLQQAWDPRILLGACDGRDAAAISLVTCD